MSKTAFDSILDRLSGETRIVPVIGHPVVQVKSPAALTAGFFEQGRNTLCIPMDVEAAHLDVTLAALAAIQNLDGIVVTVPHKMTAVAACATLTERARFIGAVNVIRRGADGSLHGDMCDGEGFVAAARQKEALFPRSKALLLGAGGAGSAVAHAMAQAGVAKLAIAEVDANRRDDLIGRLRGAGHDAVAHDGGGLADFSVIVNASPIGMNSTKSPMSLEGIKPDCFVGDVVTRPEVTAFIEDARARGCLTATGTDMYKAVAKLILTFLARNGEAVL
ncbi:MULTISPECIES: shikimate dehydrogenase [unclassified Mesorhizobium]|uniref:shikimate dehydrogenase family protein n=1 Tax=unclassified Mesorhizobium TaxID=325217 RepID=UPI0013DEBAF5|nr:MULTISPECIES: shikimate dehydrogenase [unclassified Mesorhizobium]